MKSLILRKFRTRSSSAPRPSPRPPNIIRRDIRHQSSIRQSRTTGATGSSRYSATPNTERGRYSAPFRVGSCRAVGIGWGQHRVLLKVCPFPRGTTTDSGRQRPVPVWRDTMDPRIPCRTTWGATTTIKERPCLGGEHQRLSQLHSYPARHSTSQEQDSMVHIQQDSMVYIHILRKKHRSRNGRMAAVPPGHGITEVSRTSAAPGTSRWLRYGK